MNFKTKHQGKCKNLEKEADKTTKINTTKINTTKKGRSMQLLFDWSPTCNLSDLSGPTMLGILKFQPTQPLRSSKQTCPYHDKVPTTCESRQHILKQKCEHSLLCRIQLLVIWDYGIDSVFLTIVSDLAPADLAIGMCIQKEVSLYRQSLVLHTN